MRIQLSALCLAAAPAFATPLAPVMDGFFQDWSRVPAGVTDPVGDASASFDVVALDGIATNGRLALCVTLDDALNLQAGPGFQGTLHFTVTPVKSPKEQFTINMRSRSISSASGTPLDWGVIDYVSAPTVASTKFEMSIDTRALGYEIGDELEITLGGSDALAKPLSLTVERGPQVTTVRQDPSKQKGALRVCSVNTLQTGTQNQSRALALGQLLDAMDADIVCLQEEYQSSATQIENWIEIFDVLEDGSGWSVVKVGSNAVAVPASTTVTSVPGSGDGFALAIVDTGDIAIAVGSVHLKCCGFAGSSEDNRRIDQAEGMRDLIVDLRSANLGSAFEQYADAPFLLIGDWNLVGSGGARDLFTDDQMLDAIDLAPVRLRGDRNTTWRDLTPNNGGFPPGRLDLAVASDTLPVERTFVFDTADLDEETLAGMGLSREDSRATDHLMLVLDLTTD